MIPRGEAVPRRFPHHVFALRSILTRMIRGFLSAALITNYVASVPEFVAGSECVERSKTPVYVDSEGEWPSAGASVVRGMDLIPHAPAGLFPSHRDGWMVLVHGSPADRDLEVRAAVARSSYVAPAFVDRLGGMAWPEPAVLVMFAPATPDVVRDEALALLGPKAEMHAYASIPGLYRVILATRNGESVVSGAATLARHHAVRLSEPDMSITGRAADVWVPSDPNFSACWGHANTGQQPGWLRGFDMRSTHAWAITSGRDDVRVLVIDTGVDPSHPDIRQSLGRDFTNGLPEGSQGGGPQNACDRHGTPVASCVSSKANNAIGTVGAAPGCTSVSARCFVSNMDCSGTWSTTYSWGVNALDWAARNGVRVTNNSNSYGGSSSALAAAYSATRALGIVHFASAGNHNGSISYPARLQSVLAIGAVEPNGVRASFSCFGPELFAVAPGTSVYAADVSGAGGYSSTDYAIVWGTSFASPYSAGIAALVLSRSPELGADAVVAALASTARDLGTTGRDDFHGHGLLQADGAVRAGVSCIADLSGDGTVNGTDLGVLVGDWGTASATSDLDGDGTVSGIDLGMLLGSWGVCD